MPRAGRAVEITIEADDPGEPLDAIVEAAGAMYERLTSDVEADLRRPVAVELQRAAYSQRSGAPPTGELEEAVSVMRLVSVCFDERGALVAWTVGDFLADNQVVTAQVDRQWQLDLDSVEVQARHPPSAPGR